MTDRELLLENNAKLKTIQETLKNKILAIDNKEVKVTFPQEFAKVDKVYSFQVNKDTILFSGTGVAIGLWSYNLNNEQWKQVYTGNLGWQNFQLVGDRCLIGNGANYNNGVLAYDIATNTAEKLYDKDTNWNHFKVIGKDCLITGSNMNTGVLLYEYETNTIRQVYSENNAWFYFQEFDGNCFISSGNYAQGLLFYDGSTKSVEKIYDGGGWQYYYKFKDVWLIIKGNNSHADTVLIYNTITKTIKLGYTGASGYQSPYYHEIENKCLISQGDGVLAYDDETKEITQVISSPASQIRFNYYQDVKTDCLITTDGSYGLYVYNSITNSANQLTSSGGFSRFYLIDNKCLTSSYSSSSEKGLWIYKFDDKSFSQIYNEGYYWTYFHEFGDVVLIGSGSSSVKGVLVYNKLDGTAVKGFTSYDSYKYFQTVGDRVLIGSSTDTSSSGLLVYYGDTNTFKQKITTREKFQYFYVVGNDCLIGSASNYDNTGWLGVYKYNTDTVSGATTSGYAWDIFTPDDIGNCHISSSDVKEKRTFYYDTTSQTFSLSKYNLGVV